MKTESVAQLGSEIETQSIILEETCAVIEAVMDNLEQFQNHNIWQFGIHSAFLLLSSAHRSLKKQMADVQRIAVKTYEFKDTVDFKL